MRRLVGFPITSSHCCYLASVSWQNRCWSHCHLCYYYSTTGLWDALRNGGLLVCLSKRFRFSCAWKVQYSPALLTSGKCSVRLGLPSSIPTTCIPRRYAPFCHSRRWSLFRQRSFESDAISLTFSRVGFGFL